MAMPIKETPVLKGRDANRFVKRMCQAESKPVSRAEYERERKVYDQMKQKSKAMF